MEVILSDIYAHQVNWHITDAKRHETFLLEHDDAKPFYIATTGLRCFNSKRSSAPVTLPQNFKPATPFVKYIGNRWHDRKN